jgi:hypothetical protein
MPVTNITAERSSLVKPLYQRSVTIEATLLYQMPKFNTAAALNPSTGHNHDLVPSSQSIYPPHHHNLDFREVCRCWPDPVSFIRSLFSALP